MVVKICSVSYNIVVTNNFEGMLLMPSLLQVLLTLTLKKGAVCFEVRSYSLREKVYWVLKAKSLAKYLDLRDK